MLLIYSIAFIISIGGFAFLRKISISKRLLISALLFCLLVVFFTLAVQQVGDKAMPGATTVPWESL